MTMPKRFVELEISNEHFQPIEEVYFIYHGNEELVARFIPANETRLVKVPIYPFYGPSDLEEPKEKIQLVFRYHGGTLKKHCEVCFPDGANKLSFSWKQGILSVDATVIS